MQEERSEAAVAQGVADATAQADTGTAATDSAAPGPVTQEQAHSIAEVMLKAGTILLKSGCQVRDVEDTTLKLGRSFTNDASCSSYITLTGIIVCVSTPTKDVTKLASIDDIGHDLWAVAQTMRLAKRAAATPMTVEAALAELDRIEEGPSHRGLLMALAYAVGAMGCVIFYGSTGPFWLTMALVGAGAMLVYLVSWLTDRLLPNAYVGIIVQSAVATAACALFHRFFPATDMGSMLIPILMLLVPGLTFTSSILDTLSGDYLSGNARLMIALLVGISIAIGTAVVLHYTGVLTWNLS